MTKPTAALKFTRYDPSEGEGLTAAKDGEYVSVKQLQAALRVYWHDMLDKAKEFDADEDDPMSRQFMVTCNAKAATAKYFLDMIDGE
jgi:hypothetical protein